MFPFSKPSLSTKVWEVAWMRSTAAHQITRKSALPGSAGSPSSILTHINACIYKDFHGTKSSSERRSLGRWQNHSIFGSATLETSPCWCHCWCFPHQSTVQCRDQRDQNDWDQPRPQRWCGGHVTCLSCLQIPCRFNKRVISHIWVILYSWLARSY